jgi:hypothetical protein
MTWFRCFTHEAIRRATGGKSRLMWKVGIASTSEFGQIWMASYLVICEFILYCELHIYICVLPVWYNQYMRIHHCIYIYIMYPCASDCKCTDDPNHVHFKRFRHTISGFKALSLGITSLFLSQFSRFKQLQPNNVSDLRNQYSCTHIYNRL